MTNRRTTSSPERRAKASGAAARSNGREDRHKMAHRERLLAAAADEVTQRGYFNTTTAEVAARAGLPHNAFHEHFESLEECLSVAFEVLMQRSLAQAMLAFRRAPGEWPARVRAALEAYVEFLQARASAVRACLVEAPRAMSDGEAHRARGLALMEHTFAEMMEEAPSKARPAPQAARRAAENVWKEVERHARETRLDALHERVEALCRSTVAQAQG